MLAFEEKKVVRLHQLVQMVGLARSTLYDIQNPKSSRYDPTFPKKVRLSSRAIGWFWPEVEAWLHAKRQANQTSKGGLQ